MFFGQYLLNNVEQRPDGTALITENSILSYKQLNEESNRLTNSLAGLGLGVGDRLAVHIKSGVEWILIWYACQKLGIAVVPLHLRLMVDEIARAVNLAEASALVYDANYEENAARIQQECSRVKLFIRVGISDQELAGEERVSGALPWESLRGTDCTEAQIELDDDLPAVILFTSGTTGVPKGVLRTQQMVCSHAAVLAEENPDSDRSNIMLTPAPLYHTAGLFCIFKTAALGGTLILINGFNCVRICSMIERYRVSQIMLVPPVSYQRLFQSEAAKEHDLSSVRLALLTAGKCTDECLSEIFRMFPNCRVRPSWGSTEVCSATGANLSREELEAKPQLKRTVGMANRLTQIRLVDEQGNDVPAGSDGEALVKSCLVFSGYLGNPELTEKSFSDGWFRTGDIMRRDSDGYYYIMDRKKDMIKSGGENIYAQEIERVIQNYPPILDSAVIGIPDERFDEAVAAAVTLRNGYTLDVNDFIEFCRQHLPDFKKPRYLAVMEQLPTNDVGKIQKGVLRKNAGKLFKRIC